MNENRIGLSTSCVYPNPAEAAFAMAAKLGYDGVEVMVTTEPITQIGRSLTRLVEAHSMPVISIHAPTLLISQRVWNRHAWEKIDCSIELAQQVGASTVVVHPPFRWQRDYAEEFVEGVAVRETESGIQIAVENMFPWRAAGRDVSAYLPHHDPVDFSYASVTLDFSHAATAQANSLDLATQLGPRVRHVHLGDGSGSYKDEHLVPGRGNQPCAEVLGKLAQDGYDGDVVVEVSTRRRTPRQREYDLAESLAFARLYLSERRDG